MNIRRIFLWLAVVILLGGAGSVWLLQAQVPVNPIAAPTFIPNLVTITVPTRVVATASIPDPTINPTSVELLRIKADGSSILLVPMYDDGRNGDQKPGDRVFTAVLTLTELSPASFGFQVAVVFSGRNRLLSAIQQFAALAPTTVPVILPPDPGEAGKVTLGGIDSDRDGVRDDIQRDIIFTYPQSARSRAALIQLAKALQNGISNTTGFRQTLFNALDCKDYTFMTSDVDVAGGRVAYEVSRSLEKIALNTSDRAKAFLNADTQAGTSVGLQDTPYQQLSSHCLISPSSLPN
jgi:hypothetical protein